MDKKALFISTMKADEGSVETLSDNRFRVGVNEFHVWTDEEAAGWGYLAGGIATSDASYKIYRIM
jgi:hypothetical protein